MIDYFSYLFSEKSKFKKKKYLQLTLYDGQHQTSFGFLLRCVRNVSKQLMSLLVSQVSCLSKNRTNSVSWVRKGQPACLTVAQGNIGK